MVRDRPKIEVPEVKAEVKPPLDYHFWVSLPILLALACLVVPDQIQSVLQSITSGQVGSLVISNSPPSSGVTPSAEPTEKPNNQGGTSSGWVNPFPQGQLTSGFGYRRVPNKPEFDGCHYGIDLAGPHGAPVYAAKSGVVEYAGDYGDGYGYKVVLSHKDGSKSLYGHNSKLYVKTGDTVEQNGVIAALGSTGRSTGPHLHFEATDASSNVIDPLTIFPQPSQGGSFGSIDTTRTCNPKQL